MPRIIKYDSRGIAHIYQRGFNMSVLFYSVRDILVFYTIIYTLKIKYCIMVLGVVCMFNHYHLTVRAKSHDIIARFLCELEAAYAREFNKDAGIRGHVFMPVYGLSNKVGNKKQKEASAYLYNNPVEKQLAVNAESYRWNFMAYAESDHPFSKKLIVRKASINMRKCLLEVRSMFDRGQYLNHYFLRKCFTSLSPDEREQLVDHIIVKFKVVDYKYLIRLYGSYGNMKIAFASNVGSEHDFKEEYSDGSYEPYYRLIKSLSRDYGFANPKDVLRLSDEDRRKLCNTMIRKQHVSSFIAGTLLRVYKLKPKRRSNEDIVSL